jgi:hypothetical protein
VSYMVDESLKQHISVEVLSSTVNWYWLNKSIKPKSFSSLLKNKSLDNCNSFFGWSEKPSIRMALLTGRMALSLYRYRCCPWPWITW